MDPIIIYREVFLKIDIKLLIIILLVGIIGILLGIVIGKGFSPTTTSSPVNYGGGDDGKLAKEYKEKVILKVIREQAKDLQTCYFELLHKKPKISEGVLDFILKVEEDGKISNANLIKNEFGDGEMGKCVTQKLLSYHLSPPPFGINRYMAHTLAFKSEETAKKEAAEREKLNQPPKMMPVNP